MTEPHPTAAEVFELIAPAIAAGDVGPLLQRCADDVVFEFPFAPDGRPRAVHGLPAVAGFLAALPAGGRERDMVDVRLHRTVDPATVVAEWRLRDHPRPGDPVLEQGYLVVLTVEGGLITRYRDHWGPRQAAA